MQKKLRLVHTADTYKTRLSCLVRVSVVMFSFKIFVSDSLDLSVSAVQTSGRVCTVIGCRLFTIQSLAYEATVTPHSRGRQSVVASTKDCSRNTEQAFYACRSCAITQFRPQIFHLQIKLRLGFAHHW